MLDAKVAAFELLQHCVLGGDRQGVTVMVGTISEPQVRLEGREGPRVVLE